MKSLLKYKKSYIFPQYVTCWSKNFNLLKKYKQNSGRNNLGRICVWHKGGGHKRKYRLLDKKNLNFFNRLISIEYDPNRSGFIGLFLNISKSSLFYDLVSSEQKIGGVYKFTKNVDETFVGNKMPLLYIPLGTLIHSLEYKKGRGSQYLRSAGIYGKVQKKDFNLNIAFIKMPSKKLITVPLSCIATIGIVSNLFHKNKVIGKAGRNRWLNHRPTVRGVAMNPVDHPHGGGEGKTSGGRPSVSPWGKLTRGKKSVKKGGLQF